MNSNHCSKSAHITKIIKELGVPSNIKGYEYIREGISILYDQPELIGSFSKSLYPNIAVKYGAKPRNVERAIRHAIETSWNRGSWEVMEEVFGHSVDIEKAKPTNSEYLTAIADKVRLDYEHI